MVEGYAGEVQFDDAIRDNRIVRGLTERISAERPLSSRRIESIVLRLNDLPGVAVRAVIEPLEDARKNQGAVKLVLVRESKPGKGSVSFDNYNSRYLGPLEGIASYSASIVPLQETAVSGLSSDPTEKLKYINVSHTIAIAADLTAQLYAGYTKAHPGFTLAPDQVESDARNFGVSLKKQFIRQRQENLSASLTFDAKNNATDVLQAPLTRDRMRAIRGNMACDRNDPLGGYDYVTFAASHGLPVLHANDPGEAMISRVGAEPDFTKARIQPDAIPAADTRLDRRNGGDGQRASGPLYSSEQFGYGGQAFGRAYDPSRNSGRQRRRRIAGAALLRLAATGQGRVHALRFLRIGKVWSEGVAAKSGASAGLGVRADSGFGLSGTFTAAKPLTLKLAGPGIGKREESAVLIPGAVRFLMAFQQLRTNQRYAKCNQDLTHFMP